jgi:hypothetical protein
MRSMNITKKIIISTCGAAFAGVLTIGAVASAATPTAGTTGLAHDRAAFICSHQSEISDRLAKAETRINERIATLTGRRAQADAAGHTQVVARIDTRLTRLNTLLDRVTKRATQLPVWVAAHCDATPPATPVS